MLEFSKRFSNEIWNVFSYLVKILGIKRTGFPILSQQKMKEHDDMLKDINLYHLNLEFIVIF